MQRPSRVTHETFAERTETAFEPLAIRLKKAIDRINENYLRPCVAGCFSCLPVRPHSYRGFQANDIANRAYSYFDFYDEDDLAFEDELTGLLNAEDDNSRMAQPPPAPRRRSGAWAWRKWFGRPTYKPSMADLRGVTGRGRSNTARSSDTSNSFRSRGDLLEESADEDARLVSDEFMMNLDSESTPQRTENTRPRVQSDLRSPEGLSDQQLREQERDQARVEDRDASERRGRAMKLALQRGLSYETFRPEDLSTLPQKRKSDENPPSTAPPISPISSVPIIPTTAM